MAAKKKTPVAQNPSADDAATTMPPDWDPTRDIKFVEFAASRAGMGFDPLSEDGLRMQALFILETGDHPLDILKQTMTSIFVTPRERVSAAKAVLEYTARKVPSTFEVTGKDGAPLTQLPAEALKKLTDAELLTYQALCTKMAGGLI